MKEFLGKHNLLPTWVKCLEFHNVPNKGIDSHSTAVRMDLSIAVGMESNPSSAGGIVSNLLCAVGIESNVSCAVGMDSNMLKSVSNATDDI